MGMQAERKSRIEKLKNFLLDEPEDHFTRYALALEMFLAEQHEESELQFRRILDADPQYLAVYYQYGKLLESMQRYKEALHIFESGLPVAKAQNNLRTWKELTAARDALTEELNQME